jgi:5-oxopent-3-ene-1,2,5-tricarboxylate decarboxylase/2-hydroxyhepta-2,4-diene-1,7-dioate isomerase
MSLSDVCLDLPPYRLSGAVYGALLNHPGEVAALGDAARQPPYKAPPQAPVLTVRPRNTLRWAHEATVHVPAGVQQLAVHASLAIVLQRAACRVPAVQALDWVAGYALALDLRVPHDSHYRPALRFMARDGFCTLGPRLVNAADVPNPDGLNLSLQVDGITAQHSSTGGRTRDVAQLMADVSDFMTLQAGDVLLLGSAPNAPLAAAGQSISLECPALGSLRLQLVAEGARA